MADDNVLCDEETGAVTGLLDFEFCGNDWRAIELAVCLSKYVGEEDPLCAARCRPTQQSHAVVRHPTNVPCLALTSRPVDSESLVCESTR